MQPETRHRRAGRCSGQSHEPARRAQYPEDTAAPVSNDVPDYSAPAGNPYPSYYNNYPQQPRTTYSQPTYQSPYQQNAAYTNPNQYNQNPYGRFPANQSYSARSRYNEGSTLPPRSTHTLLWLLIAFLCIVILAVGGYIVYSLYQNNYPVFKAKENYIETDTFYNGVHVDGIHIGGMTMSEARTALTQNAAYNDQFFALSVSIDGTTWKITQNEVPLARNIDAVLSEAYSIGRQGTLDTLTSSSTPFEARYRDTQGVNQSGAFLYTEITYDKATVRSLAENLSARMAVSPQDASVTQFDFSTRSFQYVSEQVGRQISSEDIYNAIVTQMDNHNYNGSVTLYTQAVQPSVTVDTLRQSFGLISTYTTTTLAGYNRNKNIEIACAAVSGITLQPGETFSFNSTTGRRTVDKGYLPAGAIAQGTSIDEVGGGVCQVSSTIFNAAAMANLEIVYSSPHAWPSSYVDPGRDATVDWQSYQTLKESLDFKFKNSSDYPIFIVAYLTGSNYNKQCKCTVEIYGVALADGITIQLQTELVSTTPAPTEVERVYNAELEYGTEKEVRKARDGYVYKTYRVFYQNGVEVRRTLLRTSTYKTYSQKIEYNY